MQIDSGEVRVLKTLCENSLPTIKKSETKVKMENLIKKLDLMEECSIGFYVSDEDQQNIDYVMEESNKIVKEMSRTKDMSLIIEYDSLKKKAMPLLHLLGDISAKFVVNADFAKDNLKNVLTKIILELQKDNPKLSAVKAESVAKIDNRYIMAAEEYRLYKMMAETLKNRRNAFEDVYQGIVQCVSTGRNGMVIEGYQR